MITIFTFLIITIVRFKNLWTKFWNRCHYSTIYQIYLIQIAFQSSHRIELDFLSFAIRICFNVKSQRTKKIEVFSQGTNDSENLRCEILYIGYYENVNIFSFAVLGIKLWVEEDGDFNRNDPLCSFKFIQSKVQNWYKMLSSLSCNFISKTANFKIFPYL